MKSLKTWKSGIYISSALIVIYSHIPDALFLQNCLKILQNRYNLKYTLKKCHGTSVHKYIFKTVFFKYRYFGIQIF